MVRVKILKTFNCYDLCQLLYLDLLCIRGVPDHAEAEVLEGVHVGDECFVGGVVGIEIFVHIAVVEPFGAHIVEVIRGLEFAPVADELFVVRFNHIFFEIVDALNRIVLHRVREPCGQIALDIRP